MHRIVRAMLMHLRRRFPRVWGDACRQPITFEVPLEQGEEGYHNQEMEDFLEGDMCKKVARVVEDYCIKWVVPQRDPAGRQLHPTAPAFDDFAEAFVKATDGKWTLQSVYNGLDEDVWKSPRSFDMSHKTVR